MAKHVSHYDLPLLLFDNFLHTVNMLTKYKEYEYI
jgi:hypothetical protein